MNAGLSTLEEEAGDQARDWESVPAQRHRARKLEQQLGLPQPAWFGPRPGSPPTAPTRPLMRFPHLAQRMFNTPLAITADKAEIIMAALADRPASRTFPRRRHRLKPCASRPARTWGDPIYETPHTTWVQGVAILVQVPPRIAPTSWPRSGMTG